METTIRIADIIQKHHKQLLADWLEEQGRTTRRLDLLSDTERRRESEEFLTIMQQVSHENLESLNTAEWNPMKDFIKRLSFARAEKGFNPSETATFILSFKQPLFSLLRKEYEADPKAYADAIWSATTLLDKIGLYTTEVYQSARNAIIDRQQKEIMELSTPVVRLWSGILALPLIGTLDSERTQVVMENLLKTLVETGSSIAIIDITGVPTVDTLVAQYLLKTIAAARLMGADCFISGIRPQIAQTIVHLGVSLPDVTTKGTLADAFAVALRRMGLKVVKSDQTS